MFKAYNHNGTLIAESDSASDIFKQAKQYHEQTGNAYFIEEETKQATEMTRQEMIDALVDDDINGWYDRADQADYLSYLLRKGIIGYENWHDQELENECFDRGILEKTDA